MAEVFTNMQCMRWGNPLQKRGAINEYTICPVEFGNYVIIHSIALFCIALFCLHHATIRRVVQIRAGTPK